MKKWKADNNYMGEDLSDYFVTYSVTRDSDLLIQSNYEAFKEALIELDGVEEHSFGHWACGWINAIMILDHETNKEAIEKAEEMHKDLMDYPILNEEDYSRRRLEYAIDLWHDLSQWERKEFLEKTGISKKRATQNNLLKIPGWMYLEEYLTADA